MKNKMTDEYLLERGYKKYPPTYYSNYVVAMFQKRFDDDFGKKYFINVLKWSHDYVPTCRRDEWWEPFSYEYEVQVTMSENDNGLDLKFHSSWTLEEVEIFIEEFFEKMKPNYYEDWDDNRRVRPQ